MIKYIKNTSKILILPALALSVLSSCSDLEVEETDSLLVTNFEGIQTAEEAASSVTAMYNQINGYIGDQANLFALSEVTTDELLVPTRGSDWGDNGIWRQLHQHTWTPDHSYITNVWNQWNELQLTASEVLDSRSASSEASRADAAFLRALGMYVILDNYGQVPYRDTTADPLDDPAVLTGNEAVDFIVADLETAISTLPATAPDGETVAASKSAARYLLAKVLLNKHIFNGSGAADSADMNRVVSLVDEINGDGFGLVAGYFDIFKADTDQETIFWVKTSVGNRIWNGLHYNLTTPDQAGGWNGFSTLAEFYDIFEGDANSNLEGGDQEERRGFVPSAGKPAGIDGTTDKDADGLADGSNIGFGFLIGQQFAPNGDELTDRGTSPLNFTRDFTNSTNGEKSLIENSEVTGIRVIKYHPQYGEFAEHEIFFRYSDAHLMKAEAIMRSGGDPTVLVNELRVLRGADPLAAVTEQDLLDERGRELYAEFWRRNDMIRFGQYTKDWEFKDPSAIGDTNKQLFPIPATQIILNPNLVQNPGY